MTLTNTMTPTDSPVVFKFTVGGKYGFLHRCLEADFQNKAK